MQIGSQSFAVSRNLPSVKKIIAPKFLLAECPAVVTLEVEDCSPEDCRVAWFSSDEHGSRMQPLRSGHVAQFGSEYVGSLMEVVVMPRDSFGCEGEPRSEGFIEVLEGPVPSSPIRARHAHTAKRCGTDQLRVVSYNLLADFYTKSDYSASNLFPHCPPHFLDFGYRQQVGLLLLDLRASRCLPSENIHWPRDHTTHL